jgi:OOP family OmpA-OmpF porin
MRTFILCLAAVSTSAIAQTPSAVRYVFFDWGKTELSRDAKAELDKVASDYAANARPMTLDGHSDRSGPASANVQSSRARAVLVRDYLAGKGVPLSAMSVRAYGESVPYIATEDGVREVQNRRVDIRWISG